MAGDPADICGAPIDIVVLDVEDGFKGRRDMGEVAAGRVQNALGTAGCAARVENEERVFGVELGRRTFRVRLGHGLVVPDVAALLEGDGLLSALDDDYFFNRGRLCDSFVDGVLEREGRALPVATVGSHDELRFGIVDAVGEGFGGEAAEYDGVRCADSRAGEHGDREFGNHRHVKADTVALLHALGL